MKRNQIGAIEMDTKTGKIWWGGNDFAQTRESERGIYCKIDMYQELSNISDSDAEIESNYDKMDRLFCVCKLIESFGDNLSLLNEAGVVMNDYLLRGAFDKKFNSLAIRNAYVDDLVAKLIEETNNFRGASAYQVSVDFQNWWKSDVIDLNYYKDENGNHILEKPNAVSVNGTENNIYDLFKGLSPTLAYTKVDSKRITLSYSALAKKENQKIVRDIIKNSRHGISYTQQSDLIITGIAAATSDTSAKTGDPTQFVKNIYAGKYNDTKPKVGIGPLVIPLIMACISLITAIIGYFQAKKEAEAAVKIAKINKEGLEIAAEDNARKLEASIEKTKISYKYFLYGAAILAAISLLD
jgi:hypothetical protein